MPKQSKPKPKPKQSKPSPNPESRWVLEYINPGANAPKLITLARPHAEALRALEIAEGLGLRARLREASAEERAQAEEKFRQRRRRGTRP